MRLAARRRFAIAAAGLSACLTFFLAAAHPAAAAPDVEALRADINFDWMATAAALVLLMQIGFMLLEAGVARSKNSINVAQKNLADFALSVVCFAVVGFMLMFGASLGGWIGAESGFAMLTSLDDGQLVFFVFQAMFVGAAATRMTRSGGCWCKRPISPIKSAPRSMRPISPAGAPSAILSARW